MTEKKRLSQVYFDKANEQEAFREWLDADRRGALSELLQIPVGTVRSRLSRARQQLQEMLEPAADGVAFEQAAAHYAIPPAPDSRGALV